MYQHSFECPKCKGKGKIDGASTCDLCKGDGTVFLNTKDKDAALRAEKKIKQLTKAGNSFL